MRVPRMILIGLAAVLFLLGGDPRGVAGGPAAEAPSTFSFDIAIHRAAANPEMVVCEAKLADAETGEVLFAPKVVGRVGEQGKTSGSRRLRGVALSYELTYTAAQGNASFGLRVFEEGKNVLATKGTFKI